MDRQTDRHPTPGMGALRGGGWGKNTRRLPATLGCEGIVSFNWLLGLGRLGRLVCLGFLRQVQHGGRYPTQAARATGSAGWAFLCLASGMVVPFYVLPFFFFFFRPSASLNEQSFGCEQRLSDKSCVWLPCVSTSLKQRAKEISYVHQARCKVR